MSNSNNIYDLKSLEREKAKLRLKLELQKQTLENRYQFLKENYKSLLWEMINPFKNSNSFVSKIAVTAKDAILPLLVGNDERANGASDSELIGLLLLKLIKRLKRKKKSVENQDL